MAHIIKRIYTGASAMYKQNIISYSPTKEHIEMLFGTNTTKYKDKYKISLQKEETFLIGIKEIDNKFYYQPERLFIELDKFHLEATVKRESINNLTKIIIPEKVKKYYEILKSKRRGFDKERIENYLATHLLNIKEVIKNNDDKKTIIREYIMALISRDNLPICLIKGGSSIELYTDIKRATLDIDTHIDHESITSVIEKLTQKDKEIYFKLKEEIDFTKSLIVKCTLIPVSKGGVLKKELENIEIQISFNKIYSKKDLQRMIIDFKITKRKLKYLNNATCLVFSREMLLAEKFQSIISKPIETTRTKDLIDLQLL